MWNLCSRPVMALFLLTVLSATPAAAQKFTGDVEGNVTDSSGASLPGASVTVRSLGTGAIRATKTSDIGAYRVPDLDVGAYEVTVTATGFKTQVRQVQVSSNGVATLS